MNNEESVYMSKREKFIFIAGAVLGFVLVNFSGKILYAFTDCRPGLAHETRVIGDVVAI